ncbi:DUF6879 family protein [Labedaea rhizosphaerae]|uniref:DUF6879 domain-containing protein n=1 Tax=Labedaea rhizosphaerae TaxID=598644 RepID=A0A4R6SNT3_LABRH|nr:DUF6879 family protein [Labedaea rhizosphaerae]TDQ05809.1 hypothetical protein EV186_1011787 [Labedaea rhizosphaerae]
MTRLHFAIEDFAALFDTVRRSSWRWECQGFYAIDAGELDSWLAGEAVPSTAEDEAWEEYVRGLRAAGIPFERLRVLADPPTDYERWMLAVTDRSLDIGEDVRWVDRSVVARLGDAPAYDYYIFDDDRVLLLEFDDVKNLTGLVLDDGPDVVARHQRWRDIVWPHAVPHVEMVNARK